MAKPKTKIYIEKGTGGWYTVWVENAPNIISEVLSIEGVYEIHSEGKSNITVWIDKRYDGAEVMAEVKGLLLSEVPQAFKE